MAKKQVNTLATNASAKNRNAKVAPGDPIPKPSGNKTSASRPDTAKTVVNESRPQTAQKKVKSNTQTKSTQVQAKPGAKLNSSVAQAKATTREQANQFQDDVEGEAINNLFNENKRSSNKDTSVIDGVSINILFREPKNYAGYGKFSSWRSLNQQFIQRNYNPKNQI
jgi:hypothetical protein